MQPEKLQVALTERQREAGLYLESQTTMRSSSRGTIRFWRFFSAWRNDRKHTGRS
jgi:hypothetical protein